jgi:glycosyltransferase involved in cell wall biosynthesis
MKNQFSTSNVQEMQEINLTGVSIVIPVYNEEEGVGQVILDLKHEFSQLDINFELIVVDDGSKDQTIQTIEEFQDVRLIRHIVNRGYGAALKSGIRQARFEHICITDADCTYPVNRIPDLLRLMVSSEVDMVVGARLGKEVAIPTIRKPAKWLIAKLANFVVNEPILDLNSGLRIFKRSSIFQFLSILPDGFSFTTTITLGMLSNGYLVDYLPIEYFPRVGKSKIKPFSDTKNFINLIFRIALYFAPLKIFLPISVVIFFVGLAWAIFTLNVFGRIADASTAVILLSAVQIAVFGLLAEMINRRFPGYRKPESFK